MRSSIGFFLALFAVACGGTTADVSGSGDAGGSDGGTTPVACTDGACLSGELDWGANGGLVSSVDSSRLASCTSYVHSRTDSSGGGTALSCTDTLASECGSESKVTAADVASALKDPDVVAALGASTKLYGGDMRPCDGSVFEFSYEGKTIDIGTDDCSGCTGSNACVAVPKGLRALATTLQNLDEQELQTPKCKSAFGI